MCHISYFENYFFMKSGPICGLVIVYLLLFTEMGVLQLKGNNIFMWLFTCLLSLFVYLLLMLE